VASDGFPGAIALPRPWDVEPYLLSNHGYSQVHRSWEVPGSLLVLTSGTGRSTGLLGLGDAATVATLLAQVAAEDAAQARWVTLPRGTTALAADVVTGTLAHLQGHGEWDWMWTGSPLRDADPMGVERLAVGDPEIDELLAVAHPAADTDTADPRLFGWWGLREGSALVAVVGALRFAPGLAPYLVSVATHPEHRGRGLAGRVLAAAVLDGLAETPRVGRGVSLSLYASNDRARRVYLRHGFELRHELESLRQER